MQALAITGARVWDGRGERASAGPQTIRIEDGRIAAIGGDPALERDARVWALTPEHVAIPGLIDAHVHVTLDPAGRIDEQRERPHEDVVRQSEERLAAMVRAGITTARDLGGGEWLEIGLRDRIARGELPGPRLLCAGQPLTIAAGHCHFWGGVVSGEEEIREAIERQVSHEADWIKVMATGGVNTKGSDVRTPQFSAEELALIRGESARHGRRVAAHCHGTEGIRLASRAGLRTIEHCSFAGEKGFGSDFDRALCDELAERELWVSPTVNVGWGRFMKGKDGEPSRFFEGMREIFRGHAEAGTKLIMSTDAGIPNVRHHEMARALPVFQAYTGLSAAGVLRAATSEAARALELADETGRLAPGLAADVLVVRGDPLEDLSVLEKPTLVCARGAVVLEDEAAAPQR